MEKSMCIVVGDNVTFDGDVSFSRKNNPFFEYMVFIPPTSCNTLFTTRGLLHVASPRMKDGAKILALWFWHMVVLRKSHVYLTGVLRK